MKLPPVPPRMQKLDRDPRGYPIPWNILRGKKGEAYFIVNEQRKHMTALVANLCPLCGQVNEKDLWFCGGPLSAFDPGGCYLDLPGHHECVRFALQVCPWLAAPNYHQRTDEQRMQKIPPGIFFDNTTIPDRPVLFVAVASRRMSVGPMQSPLDMPRVKPSRPLVAIEYWRHGEPLEAAVGEALVRKIMGADWRPR